MSMLQKAPSSTDYLFSRKTLTVAFSRSMYNFIVVLYMKSVQWV
jgi:hypothetical protein